MKRITLIAAIFSLIFFAIQVHAQSVPPLVNYQGMLTEANGDPIADTTAKLEFNLYDAASSGTKVWGPQVFDSIPVVNGRFNVILGTTDNDGRSIADAFGSAERYLGIKMNDQAEIGPRQKILSSPYALKALHGVPVGTINAYGGQGTLPHGWLFCDGAAVSSNDYPDLYTAIGTSWGNGSNDADTETDFNLPDLRGRFLRGVDHNQGRDDDRASRTATAPGGKDGDQVGSLQPYATALPQSSSFETNSTGQHSHYYRDIYYSEITGSVGLPDNIGSNSGTDTDNKGFQMGRDTDESGNHSHQISSGGDSETRPENVNVEWIIKIN